MRARLLAIALVLSGCGDAVVTALRLEVSFDRSLGIDQLRFEASASGQALFAPSLRPAAAGGPLPSGTGVVLVLKDAVAGQPVALHIAGLRGGAAVAAGDAMATPLWHGDATVAVQLAAIAADATPPVFAGAESAAPTGEDSIELSWRAASDDVTPASALVYRIYQSVTPGGETFAAPSYTSVPGATGIQLVGFRARSSTYFVVRALDAAGNEDENRKEVAATTPDLTPPAFAGVAQLTATDATTLAVSWQAASDNVDDAAAIRYRVFVAAAPGAESFSSPTATTAGGATAATVSGLAPAAQYYVVVHAVDSAGNEDGNRVERSVGATDATPPLFAGAASATGGINSIDLTWLAASDAVTPANQIVYLVYQATSSSGESFAQPALITPPGVTAVTVPSLLPSTMYYFVVRARDLAGNVDANQVEVHATTSATSDTTPPSFAGLQSATTGGDNTITLAWNAAADNISSPSSIVYFVYQATAAGQESYAAPSYTTPAGATSLQVGGLAPATTYYFVVRARDQAGNVDGNVMERSAATSADTTAPSFAGLASAGGSGATSVALGWAPASDDVTAASQIVYLIYQANGAGKISYALPAFTTAPGATSFTVSGLAPAAMYSFAVRARDQAGNVDGNLVTKPAATGADTTPPHFAGATGATAMSGSVVSLQWAAATDDVSASSQIVYLVYDALSSGAESYAMPVATSGPGASSTIVNGLSHATTYYFVVRARDQAGNSDGNSVEVSATTR